MPRGDLERLNRLHQEIRAELRSKDRSEDRLWDFIEQIAQELLIFRAQVEGELSVGTGRQSR